MPSAAHSTASIPGSAALAALEPLYTAHEKAVDRASQGVSRVDVTTPPLPMSGRSRFARALLRNRSHEIRAHNKPELGHQLQANLPFARGQQFRTRR